MTPSCPNCKASALRVVRAGLYVECAGCGWTQTPLDELVCEAAIYAWHRANPAPPQPIDHAFEDDFGFGEDECSVVVDEDPDSVTRCGEPVAAHALSGVAA